MTKLTASQARIPPKAFNQVAYRGERIRITRHDDEAVYLVSEQDLKLITELEDAYWARAGKAALMRHRQRGNAPLAWDTVKGKLGLDR